MKSESMGNMEGMAKINKLDTSIRSMEDETKIRVSSITRKRLSKAKALGEFNSYDDLINYLLDQVPISAPPGEEVKR